MSSKTGELVIGTFADYQYLGQELQKVDRPKISS